MDSPPAQSEPNQPLDQHQDPNMDPSTGLDLSSPASRLQPMENPSLTDASPPEKKKKGFFSKGKRLFKKLGSSKKE